MRQRRSPGHDAVRAPRSPPCAPSQPGRFHGCTSTHAQRHHARRRMPLDVYSRALLLTSTRALARRQSASSCTRSRSSSLHHRATSCALPIRHVSTPSASDADEKPAPCTVSRRAALRTAPSAGEMWLTDATRTWHERDAARRVLLTVHRRAARPPSAPRRVRRASCTRAETHRRTERAPAQIRCQTRIAACTRHGSRCRAGSRASRRAPDRSAAQRRSPSAVGGSRSSRHSTARRGSSTAPHQPSRSQQQRSAASGTAAATRRRSTPPTATSRQTGIARRQATRRARHAHHRPPPPGRSTGARRHAQRHHRSGCRSTCTRARCCSPRRAPRPGRARVALHTAPTRSTTPASRCAADAAAQHAERLRR